MTGKIGRRLILLLVSGIILSLAGCGGKNDLASASETIIPKSEVELFNLLDPYPSLADGFNPVDAWAFNSLLKDMVQSYPSETTKLFKTFYHLVITDDGQHGPLLTAMDKITSLLYVIIHQNDYDLDSFDYQDNFYRFFDGYSASNAKISGHLFPVIRKAISYIKATYSPATIDSVMDDLVAFLREDVAGKQTMRSVTQDLFAGLGKVLVRSNTYDGSSNRVGNSVNGVDQMISSLNLFSANFEGRNKFYNLIREVGNFTAITIDTSDSGYPDGKKRLKDIIKEFVLAYNVLFIGGSTYNPGADYKNTDPYVNAQLHNGLKEAFPALSLLFLRSDHPDAIIKNNGQGDYFLDSLSRALYRFNLNIPAMAMDSSLYDMVRYDGYGRDRISNGSANGLTFLEGMIYNVLAANYFGFLTRKSTSGEPSDNHDRGHGAATNGIITLNDCMYSMGNGTHSKLGNDYDAYGLCLNSRVSQADRIYRSSASFYYTERNSHKFYMGYDFPAIGLLSGNCAGDAGIPNGGESAIAPGSNDTTVGGSNDYRTYFAKVQNGIGELNTARWVMGWIARACWEGEGPYYASEGGVDNGDGTFTYYSPNGQVYATVNKTNPSNWTFSYSAGKEHYKETWQTDYYLMYAKTHEGSSLSSDKQYYAPGIVYGSSGADRFRLGKTGSSGNIAPSTYAKAITYEERIPDKDHSRECLTHEEAMFKNYQWLMGEKKFVFVIPMDIYVELCGVEISAPVYTIIEANGVQGIANARKVTSGGSFMNNYWVLKGDEGLEYPRSHGALGRDSSTPNYGDSMLYGDSRICLLVKEDHDDLIGIGDTVDIGVIGNQILSTGRVLPNVIGINLAPILRMAFIKSESFILSADAGTAGAAWGDRNRLMPVIVGAIGALHEKTYYQASASGYNYNYSGSHRYPLKVVTDGLLPPLGKPLYRRYTDSDGRWVPRIMAGGEAESSTKFLERGRDDDFYRARGNLFTTVGMLSESGKKKCDGFVVAISKTQLVSKLLELLQVYGSEVYSDPGAYDPDDYESWGGRRKFNYALEQIVTSIRTTKGEAIQYGYYNVSYPNWIFTQTDAHLNLDSILGEYLGTYETNGKGLAGMIFRHNAANDWTNYTRIMNALPELMSNNGTTLGQYNVMENVIAMMEEMLSKFRATDDELKGMRHTLGVMLYRNNGGSWATGTEIIDLLTVDYPKIHDEYREHGGSVYDLLTAAELLVKEGGIAQYLLNTMHTSYPSEQVFNELYQFLDSRVISEPQPMWVDLARLLEFSTKYIGGAPTLSELYFSNYTSYGMAPDSYDISEKEINPYQGMSGYNAESNEFDPYLVMGELLSNKSYSIEK